MLTSARALQLSGLRCGRWFRWCTPFCNFIQQPLNSREEVDRDREDDRRILLYADFGQGLQVAQLYADGLVGEQARGIDQALRRGKFALGVDDLGTLFAFGL